MSSLPAGLPATAARTIGLEATEDLAEAGPLAGPAVVLSSPGSAPEEILTVQSDAVIICSMHDFHAMPAVPIGHYAVTSSGLGLAMELLESGSLDPSLPILWTLQLPLFETLDKLQTVGLPHASTVHSVGGDIMNTFVVTAAGSGVTLDSESFRVGVEVGASLMRRGTDAGDAPATAWANQELDLLRRKHLSVLELLSPAAEAVPAVGSGTANADSRSSDTKRLENDLVLLKRRYDALDRKYAALSKSRLGALTLRMWDRRNPRNKNASTMKDGEK